MLIYVNITHLLIFAVVLGGFIGSNFGAIVIFCYSEGKIKGKKWT